ncbi:plasmid mobilization protein [Ruminococcus sp.]|uniref:plasmid mobilization protein n=1 Tax=Ruminococcus sp. TaxID=41978 RepID=UPI003F018E12
MRSKTLGINVRVTAAEKEKLSENAFYCGLSLSEYLRRLGLGKDVKAATTEKEYKAFRLIRQLKKDFDSLERSEILYRINAIENLLK